MNIVLKIKKILNFKFKTIFTRCLYFRCTVILLVRSGKSIFLCLISKDSSNRFCLGYHEYVYEYLDTVNLLGTVPDRFNRDHDRQSP